MKYKSPKTPETVDFACPNCSENLSVEPALAGSAVLCPTCEVAVWAPKAEKQKSRPRSLLFLLLLLPIAVVSVVTPLRSNEDIRDGDLATISLNTESIPRTASSAESSAQVDDTTNRNPDTINREFREERRRMEEALAEQQMLAAKRQAIIARITNLENEHGVLRRKLIDVESQSQAFDMEARNYRLQHADTIIAMEIGKEGFKAAADENNSQLERFLGGLAAGFVGGTALKPENRAEFQSVGTQLAAIEATQEEFRSTIANIRSQIAAVEQAITAAKNEL